MDADDFQSSSISSRKMRRTYLVTYSQADRSKFATRESFGDAVATAFNSGSGKVSADYWACSLEEHENGGEHYHVSVKLTGPQRWIAVKRRLHEKHGVTVNFSESHDSYYTAYKYICKSDTDVFHSANHPDLKEIGTPKTKKCIKAYRKKCKNNTTSTSTTASTNDNITTKTKPQRLSNLEVSEFMLENVIKTYTELFAKADEQKKAGKKDLANFVLARSSKALNDLLSNTWKMEAASSKISRRSIPRIDIIRQCETQDCVDGCDGLWFRCATEVLRRNRVHPIIFAEAMRELLVKVRGKYRNIIIVGPANCAKTFLLKPLQSMF